MRFFLLGLISWFCAPGSGAWAASTPTVHVPLQAPAAPAARSPAAVAASTAPINIVYPPEGYVHPAARGARIMGWVGSPKAALRINGRKVEPHALGGFLAYLPVTPGTFTFHCELDLPGATTTLDRTIFVTPALKADSTSQTVIDAEETQPADDLELRPGSWLIVGFKGTPGGQARFQIQGKRKKFPMAETNPALGLYRGATLIQPGDGFDASKIFVYLTGPDRSEVWGAAKGRLTVKSEVPAVAVVKANAAPNVKIERGEAFLMFPPAGTKFLTTGRDGPDVKLWLNHSLTGSLPASALQWLPPGTPPPHASLGVIRTEVGVDSTTVVLSLTDTVPFVVEPGETPDLLTVRLFYAVDHTNWIIYDPADRFVREIRWRQEDSGTVAVSIHLAPSARLWGYRAQWEGGALRLVLRHPPALPRSGSVLAGRVIVLDPGHMPSAPGAEGPRGLLEKDVNLAVAKGLESLLREAGAHPVMTRAGDDEVALGERPRIAREKRGELFISIHNNSMGDGEDPFERPLGFTVFYYHPHSLELAEAVHRAYQRGIRLPDEGLRYGDLLVARLTDMPAILTESAYMILPDQEALLANPWFQRRLAQTLFAGIRDFLEAERRRQRQPAQASPAQNGKNTRRQP